MIKAVIFDMDGVIADSQKIHSSVEHQILSREGVDLSPEEITRRFAGRKTAEFFVELLGDKRMDVGTLINEKNNRVLKEIKTHVDPIEGAVDLIKTLHDNGIPLAVASSSIKEVVYATLGALNLVDFFERIVCGDEVDKCKPDPEIYLKTAEQLDINPSEAVVIEDAIAGMLAAKNAGMKCIGLVVDPKSEKYPANLLVSSLSDLTIEQIKNIY